MSAATTTMISSVCRKCGTLGKLGRRSCCGRGGSWFENCGNHGNAKHAHTWYEGIQACKVSLEQSKLARSQPQLNPAQQKRNHTSDISKTYDGKTNSKVISAEVTTSTSTSANMRVPPRIVTITHNSSSMSIMTQGYETLLKTVVHASLLLLIIIF